MRTHLVIEKLSLAERHVLRLLDEIHGFPEVVVPLPVRRDVAPDDTVLLFRRHLGRDFGPNLGGHVGFLLKKKATNEKEGHAETLVEKFVLDGCHLLCVYRYNTLRDQADQR